MSISPNRRVEPVNRIYLFLSEGRVVLFSLFITAVLSIILIKVDSVISGPEGMGVVYLQFAFIREYFEGVLLSWGKSGVDFYLNTIWIDFIYPLFYALLLSSARIYFVQKIKKNEIAGAGEIFFMILPFIAAVFDYAENILHIVILSQRNYSDLLIMSASIAALFKWFILVVCLLAFLIKYKSFRKLQSLR